MTEEPAPRAPHAPQATQTPAAARGEGQGSGRPPQGDTAPPAFVSSIPPHQQAGYDAVYEVIRATPGDVWRNALIWRAVEAYRTAADAARTEEGDRYRDLDAQLTRERQARLAAEAAEHRVRAVAEAMCGTPGTSAWGERLNAAITGTALRPGLRVHEIRTAQDRTLADLAKAAGLTRETVRNIETGDTVPLPESLEALAAALGVPRSALDADQPKEETAHAGNGNAEDCPVCRPLIDQPGGVLYPWLCTAADQPKDPT